MGFLAWLFGKKEKKEEKEEVVKPVREEVDIEKVMRNIEARGKSVEEEYASVKVIDLRSDLDIDSIRDELLRNNVIIVDTKGISANRALVDELIEKLKNTVESVHGDIARVTNERFLTVPAGIKIMSK